MTNTKSVAYYRVSTDRQGQRHATTVRNVLDRAGVEGVQKAA